MKKKQRISLLDIVPASSLIGALLALGTNPSTYPVHAMSMSTAEVLEIPQRIYHSHWIKNPELLAFSQQQIQKRMKAIQDDRNIQRLSLEQKLAYFLVEKIHPWPELRITRKEIGDGIGASHEAIIRILNIWSQKGLITNYNHKILITNPSALQKLWRNEFDLSIQSSQTGDSDAIDAHVVSPD